MFLDKDFLLNTETAKKLYHEAAESCPIIDYHCHINPREIWEDPHAFRYNRAFTPELLTGTCRSCSFGEVCGGGCRSYNHFVHGKLYESPRCARNF